MNLRLSFLPIQRKALPLGKAMLQDQEAVSQDVEGGLREGLL